MVIKRNLSLAIVDIEKIEEINKVVIKYATEVREYSTHLYFSLDPIRADDIHMDITLFQLEAENESGLDKKLNDLIEELNQLNTEYAIRDEDTHEMYVEIQHFIIIDIRFDNVKFIEKGTYKRIDALNHFKNEFGICKNYNPNFRPVENMSIENIEVKPETIYLFSDSDENLLKLKECVFEKIMEINPDFEIDVRSFEFID